MNTLPRPERAISSNPAFPGLILLMFCRFILWSLPRILSITLVLLEELVILLLECGEQVYWEGRQARLLLSHSQPETARALSP